MKPTRLTAPLADNGGKNAWRHLTKADFRTVAKFAAKHGAAATKQKFGISQGTVVRACCLAKIRPAPRKGIDLAAIAKASKGSPRAVAAAELGVAESTVYKARKLYGRVAA